MAWNLLSGDPRLGPLAGQGYGGPLAGTGYVPDFSEADPAPLDLTPRNPMAVNYLEALQQALPEAAARYRVSQFQLGTPQPGLIHDVGYGYGGPLGGAVADMLQPPRTGEEAAMMFGMPALGAIKGWHGSPQTDLTKILAEPPARQFDNATSQFGAFFSPHEGGAKRYAGETGRVYSASVPVENPYEMSWKEFDYFQSPHKAADGSSASDWTARAEELKSEAAALRERLKQQGYDGVVVRGGKANDIKEIASFNDVPLGEIKAYGGTPQTYSHPISGVKLKTPIEEMNPTYDTKGVKMLPEKLIHPESLEGGYIIPMRGDPTIAGKRLTGVGGDKFEDPVTLHGGPAFARGPQQIAEGAGWASNPAPSTQLSGRAAKIASETGNPVFGAYMKMSPTSGDYSTMMSETLREMIKLNPPSRKGVKEFNKAMREEWNGFPATPGFPGVENLTDEWIRTAGKHRTKLAQMMDSKRFGDLGYPEVGVARHAITEPDLLDVPSHSSGFSVVQFPSSGEVIKNPKIAHPTYAQQNKATYEGRLPELPLDVLYGPEVRASTKPEYLAKILETKPPTVKVDQKTLDRVMKYLRSQDGAKWGLAGAVAGGLLTAEQAKELDGT